MSTDIDIPPDDVLDDLFAKVLDSLLIQESDSKWQTMMTQERDKKWQLITLHKTNLSSWGEREHGLLVSLSKCNIPDIHTIFQLKSILSTGNKDTLMNFLDCAGVSVIVKCMNNRLAKICLSELDVAILYELVLCCKALMNNRIGMDGFLNSQGAMDALVRCLLFEWKTLVLQVLLILSVCCYYSEEAANAVVSAIRRRGLSLMEAPFANLTESLLYQDVEVKSCVLQFINNMIIAIEDVQERTILRSELRQQMLTFRTDEGIKNVEKDLKVMTSLNGLVTSDPSHQEYVSQTLLTLVSLHGPKSYDQKMRHTRKDVLSSNYHRSSVPGTDSDLIKPLLGKMAGECTAAKNAEKKAGMIADFLGVSVKKTKRRWYELDGETLKWSNRTDKDHEVKGIFIFLLEI